MVHERTSALSVVPSPIMHLPGSVVHDQSRPPTTATDTFPLFTAPMFLPYRDFSSTIVHRDSLIIIDKNSLEFSDIFLSIVHPYNTDAFTHFISKHALTYFYSLLVTNLRNGFPLGEMPSLTDTVIFKNHPSTLLHSDVVDKYLTDELKAGRMSGPFSRQQVEKILRGAFFCSPLLVSVQTQQPGMPDKLRVCRHLSKGDKNNSSMNSHIHKEDFPTQFDTASKVADIVGLLSAAQLHYPRCFLTTWASPLVVLFFMGFTSSGPLHGLHLWWPSSTWVSPLVALFFVSQAPLWGLPLRHFFGDRLCCNILFYLYQMTPIAAHLFPSALLSFSFIIDNHNLIPFTSI
jgi:hypothetical protein